MPEARPHADPSTRREFLGRAVSGVLGSAVFIGPLACKEPAPKTSNLPLDQRIAQRTDQLSNQALRVLYPKGSRGNVEPVVREFRRLTRTNVELIEASLDEISAEVILSSDLGHRHFDIAIPATFGIPDLVEASAIAPLCEFAREHEPATLMENSIYTLGDRYKGRLYGYQADGDAYVMFYNRDWLTDAGHARRYEDEFGAELAVPDTWTEFDRQLAFFHDPDANRFGGSLFRTKRYAAWEYWIRLHANGVFPVSDTMQPRIDTEESRAALRSLIEATRFLDPRVLTDDLFQNFSSYAEGNKFANIGWGGTQKYLHRPDSRLRDRVTHGLVPGALLQGQRISFPYFNWGWNYVVSSKSRQQEAAYLFVLFASTPRISTLSVREASGYFDPFREEHFDDHAVRVPTARVFSKHITRVSPPAFRISICTGKVDISERFDRPCIPPSSDK